MKLSTRTRYGTRALLELAEHYGNGALQLKIIAERQGISVKYLEQLMVVLKSAGIVQSVRGAKGGYVLGRGPEKILLSEVFTVLEGPVTTSECVSNENYCGRVADCVVRGVWAEVEEAIKGVLNAVTLKDLADQARQKKVPDYQI
jgi:Rrf2 family protein